MKAVFLTVAQRDILFQFPGGVLLGGLRFAGQRGFFDLEIDGFEQAHIRRDMIASLQEDNIAGHQFAR